MKNHIAQAIKNATRESNNFTKLVVVTGEVQSVFHLNEALEAYIEVMMAHGYTLGATERAGGKVGSGSKLIFFRSETR
jgi:hypothetical protein